MKREIIFVISLVLLTSFVIASSCAPNLPITYYGTVSYNGELLEGNYIVKAILNNEISGSSDIMNGEYYIDVTPCYGISSGEISFVVNGVTANEKANYDSENWGKEIGLNLTVSELPPLDDICGNGEIEVGEECDDGNMESEDGCSAICEIEYGYTCTGQPSTCVKGQSEYCGDGICNNDETCSTCSEDCGSCSSGSDSSGGSSGSSGGSSGSGSMVIKTDNNTNLDNGAEENNTLDLNSNKDQETSPGITGGVIGFVKSNKGFCLISAFLVIIFVIGIITFLKNKSKKKE